MQFVDAVETYTEYLLKLSYLYVKDRQIAEDIVQDVFVKLYEKQGDTIDLQNVRAYVVQMTVNRCKDYFRSWQYRKVQVFDLFAQPEQASPVIAEPQLIEEVLKLPLKYREVIVLYYFDDYPIQQVSSILSLPIGTVKTRLQKGRTLLKGIIQEGGDYHEQEVESSVR